MSIHNEVTAISPCRPVSRPVEVYVGSRNDTAINKLPDEILSTIFWWCCPTYADRHGTHPFTVLRLSHVCKKWRWIANQTPSLWTSPPTTVRGLEDGCLDEPMLMLRHWLERAHDCPVVIDVDIVEGGNKRPPVNAFTQILTLIKGITEAKPFLTEKDMILSSVIDARNISNHPDDLFPDVAEQYSWSDSTTSEGSPFPARGAVQLLCSRRSPIMYGLEGHAPLGRSLTRVDLRDQFGYIAFCLDECWVLLENFPSLEHCALRIGGFGPDEETHHLEMLSLKSFAIEWRVQAGEGIGILLDSMQCPQLKELELHGRLPFRNRLVGERWPHLRQFLERNHSLLEVLELAKLDCTVLDLIGCLGALSTTNQSALTHLSLTRCLLDDECIRKLWGDESSPKVLNAIRTLIRIESLGLDHCHIYSLNDLVCSLCVDYLLWPGAGAVVSLDHSQGLKCSLEELFIINCGILSEESLAHLNVCPVQIEYEEGDPRERDEEDEE